MDSFSQFLYQSRQTELDNLASLFQNHQSASISALNGSGKSLIYTHLLPHHLTQKYQDSIRHFLINCRDPHLVDQAFELDFNPDMVNLLIIDELTPESLPNFQSLWNYLWAKRSLLNRHLVFLFLSDRPLNPSPFGQLGFCYLENQIPFSAFSLSEMTAFVKTITTSSLFDQKLIARLYQLSSANPRLVKALIKDIDSGLMLDDLLSKPISPRLTFFFNQLQSESYLSTSLLSDLFPQFSVYFNQTPPADPDLSLTSLEKKLFDYLILNTGSIVSRDAIIKAVWGDTGYLDLYDHSLDQMVYRLKQKLKATHYRIQARKGRGFLLS